MPAVVLYILPATPAQAGAGPVIVGTGNGLTVTLFDVGAAAVQLFAFV
jgi:hypothetical protein